MLLGKNLDSMACGFGEEEDFFSYIFLNKYVLIRSSMKKFRAGGWTNSSILLPLGGGGVLRQLRIFKIYKTWYKYYQTSCSGIQRNTSYRLLNSVQTLRHQKSRSIFIVALILTLLT